MGSCHGDTSNPQNKHYRTVMRLENITETMKSNPNPCLLSHITKSGRKGDKERMGHHHVPVLSLPGTDLLRNVEMRAALRTVCLMSLGLCCHYCLLRHVSGFQSPWSALLCMLLTRSLLAHPYIHVNIFQVGMKL